ncbi:hypothetical protein ACRZ5S_22915 (plasmid) [Vibrio scophthalmi]|uniref:hypothetical protein n=1 Tax=Vibrio scophthalmi TaxID=45658 RepID=UPI003EB8CF25
MTNEKHSEEQKSANAENCLIPLGLSIESQVLIDALTDRELSNLNDVELSILNFLEQQGRKFGLEVTLESEAPADELVNAKSKFQYDQIIRRYPVHVTVTKKG